MIMTLRESKAKLSKLVERAAAGEEILITVRGKPRARLVAATKVRLEGWDRELLALQQKYSLMPRNDVSVVEELREERH